MQLHRGMKITNRIKNIERVKRMSLWDKIKQLFTSSSSPSDVDEYGADEVVEPTPQQDAEAFLDAEAEKDDDSKTDEVEMITGDKLK